MSNKKKPTIKSVLSTLSSIGQINYKGLYNMCGREAADKMVARWSKEGQTKFFN